MDKNEKEIPRGWIIEAYKDGQGEVWIDYKNPSYPRIVDAPEHAQLFVAGIDEKTLSIYRKIIDLCDKGHAKFAGIHKTSIKFVEMFVRTKDVDLTAASYLHDRQILAIKKLSLDEVEALSLEKYAVFVKLEDQPKKRKRRK